jgi:Holliday junction resolvase RusA-like endonuclease
MLEGREQPTKRPDLDNCIKTIADSLNDIAYIDDSFIVEVTARKWWTEEPRVELKIEEIEREGEFKDLKKRLRTAESFLKEMEG